MVALGKWVSMAALLFGLTASAFSYGQTADSAKPDPNTVDQAEVLYRAGFELWAAGQHEKACGKFVASLELHPTVGAALNVGRCDIEFERKADAYHTFMAAAELAKQTGDGRAQAARATSAYSGRGSRRDELAA